MNPVKDDVLSKLKITKFQLPDDDADVDNDNNNRGTVKFGAAAPTPAGDIAEKDMPQEEEEGGEAVSLEDNLHLDVRNNRSSSGLMEDCICSTAEVSVNSRAPTMVNDNEEREEEEDIECLICKDIIDHGDEIIQLEACSHLFHAACLIRWLKLVSIIVVIVVIVIFVTSL